MDVQDSGYSLNSLGGGGTTLRLAFVLCLIGIPLTLVLAGGTSQRRGKRIVRSTASVPAKPRENVCGAEVRPREVLFKLRGCPAEFEPTDLRMKLQEILRATIDETLVINQVGSGCLFRAESSEKNVNQLLPLFRNLLTQQNQSVDLLLKGSGLEGLRLDYVEPNFVIHVDGKNLKNSMANEPNDDKYLKGELWGLVNPKFRGLDIDALGAWKYSTGSESIVVGIVDTGIYYRHPDLAANMWIASRAFTVNLGGRKITCSKGSHGYNALAKPGEECDPTDQSGHGTHVAGIVGAVGNNQIGVVGVNWKVRLMALKFLDADGTGVVSDAVNAIEFALQAHEQLKADANLKILNNSWGFTLDSTACPVESNSLREVMEKVRLQDILFVASAGENSDDNDQTPHFPSAFDLPNVLSVTAINSDGTLTTIQGIGSNLGKKSVHLAAPGDDIWSTCLPQKRLYCQKSFTSVAAPFVSGAGALMFSVPQCARLGAVRIRTKLLDGVVKTPSMINPSTGENLTLTGGRLNLARSIALCW